jgi:hypothetical protein
MKRILVIGLALGLTTGAAYAQNPLSGSEANVQITQQPQVVNISGSNATLKWQTNSTAANNVLYRQVGASEWKHAFEAQGSKDHSVQLTGLQPSSKYEYQILTTSNKVRTAGQFDTPAAGAATTASTTTTSSASPATSTDQTGMVANTDTSTANGRVTLYRAVNPTSGAHTFTSSQSQVPSGYQMQGVAGYLVGKQAGGKTAPLYAMSHANSDFFYTTDANERQQAIQAGWTDNGIIGYIATNQQTGTVPMYRMTGPNNLNFYTSDPTEHAQAASQGWHDVGVVGYIWSK